MQPTPAKRLIITVSEADSRHGVRLYGSLLTLFKHKGLAGATVTRALAGFTGRGPVKTLDIVDVSGPLPLRIEVVDRPELIDRVLPDVYDMVDCGLVEVQDTQIVKWWAGVDAVPPSSKREDLMRLIGKGKELQIHIGEKDTWEGERLFEAIVKRARQIGIAGVSVYRGMLGYGAHKHVHKHKPLFHDDPILISIIDSSEHVDQLLSAIDGMVTAGCLITLSDVTVIKYAPRGEEQSGVSLEAPSEAREP
jgi:PII-like signaling protein